MPQVVENLMCWSSGLGSSLHLTFLWSVHAMASFPVTPWTLAAAFFSPYHLCCLHGCLTSGLEYCSAPTQSATGTDFFGGFRGNRGVSQLRIVKTRPIKWNHRHSSSQESLGQPSSLGIAQWVSFFSGRSMSPQYWAFFHYYTLLTCPLPSFLRALTHSLSSSPLKPVIALTLAYTTVWLSQSLTQPWSCFFIL